jgi:phosphate:Na+ symporter
LEVNGIIFLHHYLVKENAMVEFGFYDVLKLIGSLGFFMYGMKIMSEGIQKAAGNRLRQILSTMTQNRVLGVLTGFLVTSLVQSSSATTVMTVSFVNAGLLSLVESAGVMMGANVGTTITGWLVSIFGFKVSIAKIALPIIAFGMPMMFVKSGRTKFWGEFLVGFALLFLGLDFLKHSVPDLKSSPEVLSFLAGFADMGILSAMMFIGIGTLLTIAVQSSSAAMALTIVMCHNGWIPFEIAAPMILGENIGTTITAELASIVGNVHAKRSARIHSMFNIVGVTWMLFAYTYFLDGINYLMVDYMGMVSPFEDAASVPIALSFFHTAFNLTNVFIMIWFVPLLVRIAERTVSSKGEEDEQFHLEFIGGYIMGAAELSLLEAKKEVKKFGELTLKMHHQTIKVFEERNPKKARKLISKIAKYEEITDRLEVEIASFLQKVSQGELSERSSIMVRSMISVIGDLERIGDIYYQLSKSLERKLDDEIWFTPDQRNNLVELIGKLGDAFDFMIENIEISADDLNINKAVDIENEIDRLRNRLRKDHLKSIGDSDYNIESGMIYTNMFSSFERIGDHIINVSEALAEK